MITVMLGALGLVFGSFVNALVWRLHEHRNWMSERSECPHCHHQLAAKDLIPVLSWLYLRGKCRYCHAKIEDSPLVEIATMVFFVVSYLWWPVAFEGAGLFRFVLWLIFVVGFVALTVYDLRWMLLPDKIVFPLASLAALQVVGVALFFHGGWHVVFGSFAGVLMVSGLFYLIFQLSKGAWIGGGDVKLGLALGLLAGSPLNAVLLLFVASVSGLLFSLPQLFRGKFSGKTQLPFGPFLILGLFVVVLFGNGIVDWYTAQLFYR